MPTLNIEGRRVNVGDEFMRLSRDQQNDAVDEIATSLRSSGHLAPAGQSQRQLSMPQYDAAGSPTGNTEMQDVQEAHPSALRNQLDDISKGIGGGLVRGAAGTVGMVTDKMPSGWNWLLDFGARNIAGQTEEQQQAERRNFAAGFPQYMRDAARGIVNAGKTENLQRYIEQATGPAYVPTTRAGKIASGAAEFVPGAMIGAPANMLRNVSLFGAIPGAVSEAAGQVFEGSAMETPARIAGGLAAGVGGALATRGSTAGNMVRSAIDGMTPQQLEAAEQLFQRAAAAGTPISRAEAVQAVTRGASGLGDLQHTVEGMGGMKPFYAGRATSNETAARQAFDQVAPRADVSSVGRQVGEAAENTLTDVRGAINRKTRPLYDAAEQQRIDPHTFAQVQRDPVFVEGLRRVREDPWIGPTLQGHADDSVKVIDAIKKQLDETGRNLRDPVAGTARNNFAASVVDQGTGRIVQAADQATGSSPGVLGTYETARTQQAQLRDRYLQPLLDGPIGKIANRDQGTKQAIEALFPANPLPNSADAVSTAVSAVAKRNPWAARQLVRSHAEMTFNEAAQRLASGPNQSGGAKFAAVLRGNSEQAANLEAAVKALPSGDTTWKGFNAFLENMEAQQFRQATGSRTAFKIPSVEDLKGGGITNNVAQVVGGGGVKLPQKVMTAIQNWNVGRNLDDLSRLLTDPTAANEFRILASTPSGSSKAVALTARLTSIALKGLPPDRDRPRVYITRDRDGR